MSTTTELTAAGMAGNSIELVPGDAWPTGGVYVGVSPSGVVWVCYSGRREDYDTMRAALCALLVPAELRDAGPHGVMAGEPGDTW